MQDNITMDSLPERATAWLKRHDEYEQSFVEIGRRTDGVPKPELPALLTECLIAADGRRKDPPEHVGGIASRWTFALLDSVIEAGGVIFSVASHTEDTISVTTSRAPLSESELAKARKMRDAAVDYESALQAYLQQCHVIEDSIQEKYADLLSQGVDIVAAPASSLADLAAKAAVVNRLDLIDGGAIEHSSDALEAMMNDIIRLAEESK
jgi:hypothetical protein